MTQKDRLFFDKIECLRALAFLGIAFAHMGVIVNWSALGVSIFFVLSGFLMTTHNLEKNIECSFVSNLKFAINKIKKIYFLHVLTTLTVFVLMFFRTLRLQEMVGERLILIKQLVLNIFLLQSWVPSSEYAGSLNSVAWYLSTALFLYFVFPCLLKVIKKINSNKLLVFIACVGIILQFIAAYVSSFFEGFDGTFVWWMVYNNPLFRIVDFFVGCMLAKLYGEIRLFENNKLKLSLCELAWLVISFGTVALQKRAFLYEWGVVFLNPTTVYIVLAAGWIYFFARGEGIVVRLCDNKFFHYIGKISAYLYLVHGALYILYNQMIGWLHITVTGIGWLAYWLIEFGLFVLFTELYMFISRKHSIKR